VLKWGRSSF